MSKDMEVGHGSSRALSPEDAKSYLYRLSQMGDAGKPVRLEQNQLDKVYESMDALRNEIYRLKDALRAERAKVIAELRAGAMERVLQQMTC